MSQLGFRLGFNVLDMVKKLMIEGARIKEDEGGSLGVFDEISWLSYDLHRRCFLTTRNIRGRIEWFTILYCDIPN